MDAIVLVLLLALMPQAPASAPAGDLYKKIEMTEPDVQAAAKVALIQASRKATVISAERHTISANNLRLCLSMNRSGNYEFARVVLSRNDKTKKWAVTLWSWGSCGR
jgi:hypothetical protein